MLAFDFIESMYKLTVRDWTNIQDQHTGPTNVEVLSLPTRLFHLVHPTCSSAITSIFPISHSAILLFLFILILLHLPSISPIPPTSLPPPPPISQIISSLPHPLSHPSPRTPHNLKQRHVGIVVAAEMQLQQQRAHGGKAGQAQHADAGARLAPDVHAAVGGVVEGGEGLDCVRMDR